MRTAPDFPLLESLLQTLRGQQPSIPTRQSNGLLMIIDPAPRDGAQRRISLETPAPESWGSLCCRHVKAPGR